MSCLRTFRIEVYARNITMPLFSKESRKFSGFGKGGYRGFFNHCMLLIVQHPKKYLISFGSVIAQLDWAIQKKVVGLSGQST